MIKSEIIIIGAGVTGLSAAIELGDRAIVLEKEKRAGGLVKTFGFNGYWFDNVVHLLHFRNAETEAYVKELMQGALKLCSPIGWVQTKEGTTRYPLQINLGSLNKQAQERCIHDFINRSVGEATSYKEFLLNSFGEAMCEIFFFPYNEKQWKTPLDAMTSSGQIWNIKQPSLDEIMEGIHNPNQIKESYNSNAYYPASEKDAYLRGMELLSQRMAENVKNIDYMQEALMIDIRGRYIFTHNQQYHYDNCLSTIPLPELMNILTPPDELKKEVNKLEWISVVYIALSIRGKRSEDFGLWHYYAHSEVPFTKVIYMTNFDKYNAPEDGYGLLIEIPVSKDNYDTIPINKIISDLRKLDVLKDDDKVIDSHSWRINYAYVIFTKETPGINDMCKEYLHQCGITIAGRYGNWEYSSMAENIEDGLSYTKTLKL